MHDLRPAWHHQHLCMLVSVLSSQLRPWPMSQPVCTVVQVPYLVDSDQDGDVALKCNNVEGGQLYPEEVSGQILAHMLAHAEQSMQASISKAVISVRRFSSLFT